MTTAQIIATILSPVFASTVTAMLRQLWPKLDGKALVWGVVLFLAVLGNVLLSLTTEAHTAVLIAWAVGRGLVGGVMAIGTVGIAQNVAGKASALRS